MMTYCGGGPKGLRSVKNVGRRSLRHKGAASQDFLRRPLFIPAEKKHLCGKVQGIDKRSGDGQITGRRSLLSGGQRKFWVYRVHLLGKAHNVSEEK